MVFVGLEKECKIANSWPRATWSIFQAIPNIKASGKITGTHREKEIHYLAAQHLCWLKKKIFLSFFLDVSPSLETCSELSSGGLSFCTSFVCALVHKTTYAPMIYTSLCLMIFDAADPVLGQVERGLSLEISSFLGPKWHSPIGSMTCHRPKKTLDFQGPTPSHLPS